MNQLLTIAPFAIIAVLVGGLLWLVRPDLLALLAWPMVLLYPKHLLHGALPMNAGLNDLFIVAVAARLLAFPVVTDSPFYRWGKPVVLLAIGMALMQFLSEVSGSLSTPASGIWAVTLKNTLKGVVFVSFALIMVRSITTEAAIRRHLIVFMATISIAFLLVWVCSWSDTMKWVFEDLGTKEREQAFAYVQATRSWGPFDYTTGLGIIIAAVVPLGVGLAAAAGTGFLRVLAVAMMASAGVAELVTKTRSALTGLAVVLLGWILLSKQRLRILAVMMLMGGVAVAFGIMSGEASKLGKRVQEERTTSDYELRADIWKTVITHPNPLMLAFGEGEAAMGVRLRLNPHSGYLDAIFLWGAGGLVMFVLLYGCTLRWARLVNREDVWSLGHGVGWGVFWSVVAIAVTSLTADTWFTSDYRFLMYFLLALLWQRREAILSRFAAASSTPMYLDDAAPDASTSLSYS